MNKRKWLPLLCLVVGAMVIEFAVCNFSACKSLLYKDRIVFENVDVEGGAKVDDSADRYTVPDGVLTLRIADVNRTIHNLFFAMDFSETVPVSYTVTFTDDGNYYPYSLPQQALMPGIPKSFYTNVYPAGKVGTIEIRFTVPAGSVVTLSGICANARIPFLISPGRFLLILGILLLFYYLTHADNWKDEPCRGSNKQRIITAVVMVLLMGLAWRLAHVNPTWITPPWPHHKQYQELAEVMTRGQLYLDAEPSEGLLNAENPYDTIYLQANGIAYLADYSYYEGKYYVYFGVVPALLVYIPVYLFTGEHVPNFVAVFLFYCGFILAVFALYREVIRRWFVRTPYFLYLLLCIMTFCCGNYLFVIARPDLYNTPIMAANTFTVAGLWLWIKGKYTESAKGRSICLLLGSLCMALVAGCRPQMLLFSALAIPLFWPELRKKTVKDIVSIGIPYLLVAAGIMYYNAARFGSPFDFGATYSLTSNDMTKRSFNLHQALLGLWHYFVRPPVIDSDFPFLQGVQIDSGSYMGKLNGEYTYGGILACNVFLWALFYIRRGKKQLQEKGIYVLLLVSVGSSLALGVVDVTGAGILQRYMVDMIWGLWFAAVLLTLAWLEKAMNSKTLQRVGLFLALACVLQAAYGFGIVLGKGSLDVNVQNYNPELYYYLQELVKF